MRFGWRVRAITLLLSSYVFCVSAFAVPTSSECQMPLDLAQVISQKFSGTRVLRLADLDPDSKSLFLKDHGRTCPGLVSVDFYGDRQPTFGLLLIAENRNQRQEAKLIVARKPTESWQVEVLDRYESSNPVIWSLGPGVYRDVYGKRTIRTKNPVIVVCEYESWAIIYGWNGKQISKVWIAD